MYTKHNWKSEKHFNFNYVKYLPQDYNETKKYPIVFFLHGAGERGDDLELACRHGYMKYVREQNADYPFIFVAPQCPEDKIWATCVESLTAFVDDMCDELPIDKDRIYVTGLSMGGMGTWLLAMANPHKFAAIAPICGSSICWYAGIVKHLPIMMYHGDLDEIVPITESITMLKAVHNNGGHAQLKICYGYGHNAWDVAYDGDELWKWLLSHKKGQ